MQYGCGALLFIGLLWMLPMASYPLIMTMCSHLCFHLVIMRHGPECKFEHVDSFVCMHNCMIISMGNHSLVFMSGSVLVWQEVNWSMLQASKSVISDSRWVPNSATNLLMSRDTSKDFQNGRFNHLTHNLWMSDDSIATCKLTRCKLIQIQDGAQ